MMRVLFTLLCLIACQVQLGATLLTDANEFFRSNYAAVKASILRKAGPIIISSGDNLVLHYNGAREEVHYRPDLYHRLKEIDHLPVVLETATRHLDSETSSAVLAQFRDLILHIKKNIDQYKFPDDLVKNQTRILDASLEMIGHLQAGERPFRDGVMDFCRQLTPYLMKNAQAAANIQLDALHSQVQRWKKQIPRSDWNRVTAIVVGPQMPRVGEVTLQYFARLTGVSLSERQVLPAWLSIETEEAADLKPSKLHRRLLYAENLWEEEQALDLFATHVLDEEIGQMFFRDKQRMHVDLLAKEGFEYLEGVCEAEGACE